MDARTQSNLWDGRQVKRALDPHYTANRARIARIVATIDGHSPSDRASVRVLNIGVGDARLEGLLLERGYQVYALDPSPDIVAWVRERYRLDASRAVHGWSQDLPFAPDTFDWVVMSEVIEHLPTEVMQQTFAQVRRVLKAGGHFVGTVPANEDLNLGRYTCAHCGQVSHRVGHEQTFTVTGLRELLARHFDVRRVHVFRGMHMNWKGVLYYHWIDFPFKVARLRRPDVRAPHQIVFSIFFLARKP
ncbi:MAG: class I SAM-dependent methyltransferase [Candidatus Latescibacteria bacterium]|nr:class I SAM-dependent methyltransferase [Candidatus Latescibacterota bacterium]